MYSEKLLLSIEGVLATEVKGLITTVNVSPFPTHHVYTSALSSPSSIRSTSSHPSYNFPYHSPSQTEPAMQPTPRTRHTLCPLPTLQPTVQMSTPSITTLTPDQLAHLLNFISLVGKINPATESETMLSSIRESAQRLQPGLAAAVDERGGDGDRGHDSGHGGDATAKALVAKAKRFKVTDALEAALAQCEEDISRVRESVEDWRGSEWDVSPSGAVNGQAAEDRLTLAVEALSRMLWTLQNGLENVINIRTQDYAAEIWSQGACDDGRDGIAEDDGWEDTNANNDRGCWNNGSCTDDDSYAFTPPSTRDDAWDYSNFHLGATKRGHADTDGVKRPSHNDLQWGATNEKYQESEPDLFPPETMANGDCYNDWTNTQTTTRDLTHDEYAGFEKVLNDCGASRLRDHANPKKQPNSDGWGGYDDKSAYDEWETPKVAKREAREDDGWHTRSARNLNQGDHVNHGWARSGKDEGGWESSNIGNGGEVHAEDTVLTPSRLTNGWGGRDGGNGDAVKGCRSNALPCQCCGTYHGTNDW